ncbi:hypothetical protein Tco_1224493, partial [Tanacetum coccineum]
MFTKIKVVSGHEDTQLYGAILPNELTNEDIKNSESYKEYYAIASGAVPPKTKASVKKKQDESDQAPTAPQGKRHKAISNVTKPSTDEGTGSKPGVPDVPTYESDDEQISWKSSDEEDDDEVGMNKDDEDNDDDDDDADNHDDDDQDDDDQDDDDQENQEMRHTTDSDNDGDDFFHPKLSNPDQEVRHNEEESDEESGEESDEEIQGVNVEEEELDEEEKNNEDEANELYRDVNVNLEGRDVEMTEAQQTNLQTTQVIEDTHVIITLVNPKGQQQSSSMSSGFVSNMLNLSLDTGIDSIFNLKIESTSLIDVSVTAIAEPPLLVKALEDNFSELNQTNQFPIVVSSIPGIVDPYLANKMHEAIKTTVQLQFKRLRDEAQAENADVINKL